MTSAVRSQATGTQTLPVATFSVAPLKRSTVQSSATSVPPQPSKQSLSMATTRPALSDDQVNALPLISARPVRTGRSPPPVIERTCRTGPLSAGSQEATKRPSGETTRERKVNDLSCGANVVRTASLVSLRTLASLLRTTKPKRSLKTTCEGVGDPAATEAVAVADGEALGEGSVLAASRSRSEVTVMATPRTKMTATAAYTPLRLIRESCASRRPSCGDVAIPSGA